MRELRTRKMITIISCSTLSILFCLYVPTEQILPPKAINPKRLQLMEDALSSMTFRKDGQLASSQDLQPFLDTLKERYHTSKYYKNLVKAFQHGILPKLTLNENDPCNPAYTLEYRDPLKNSVTDANLKKFIFESYKKSGKSVRQFCNYQKGLVCNNQTKRCECPQRSKMRPVSEGNVVERCLLEENEACALLDLDHYPNSKYRALRKRLPVMILNLERSLSCKMGTQCRFKSTSKHIPHCYSVNDRPWDKVEWNRDFEMKRKVREIQDKQKTEEKDYSNDLLGRVERDCDPREGGHCPQDRVCYEDYRDDKVMYDEFCSIPPDKRIYRTCQSLDDDRKFGQCEGKTLDTKIMEKRVELSKLRSYSRLGMGDACQYELEQNIRSWIETQDLELNIQGNKYKVLIGLDKLKNGGNTGLCDRTKLLHCSKEGTCECLPGTQPRKTVVNDGQYQTHFNSEYCYASSGNCHPHTLRSFFQATNQMEKDEINEHYSKKAEDESDESEYPDHCRGYNWCVFTRDDSYIEDDEPIFVCSSHNTGTTGFGPEENAYVKPLTQPEGSKPNARTTDKSDEIDCEGEECGFEEADGGTKREIQGKLMVISIILVLNVIG